MNCDFQPVNFNSYLLYEIELFIEGIENTRYLVPMKSFSLKLRLIYYPFLLTAAGFILAYSFLNVWLTIETAAISLKEVVTDLWLPLVLPFILLAIWLRPRIDLLNLKTKKQNNLPLLYLFIAGITIGVPTILLQDYLRTAMGKLTPLQSISQIRENKLTKYYTAKNLYIDTSLAAFKNIAIVSGKNNQYLDFTIYIACPIFDRKPAIDPAQDENAKISPAPGTVKHLADSIQIDHKSDGDGNNYPSRRAGVSELLPQAWACVKYTKQVSNRLDKSEKKENWKVFVLTTLNDFNHKDFTRLVYLDRIGNTDDRDNYEKDIIKNPYITTIPGPLLILEPRFTTFEARNGHKLGWVFGAFGIGALIWLIMLAIPKLDESTLEGEEGSLTLKRE
jgi:rhomboid protease GluP